MEPSPQDRDLARWAYFVSFASLGLGLPIPFLSLVSGVLFHLVNHRKSAFVAFHSWQALLLGLPASLIVGIWSFWGMGVMFNYFLSAGHLTVDLTPFWILGGVSAVLLTLEVILGLKGADRAARGEWYAFPLVGGLCRRLSGSFF